MPDFTHLDEKGDVRMVDVTEKEPTKRSAKAQAVIHMNRDAFEKIQAGKVEKGNVLETARIAGVMAAKKTAALIPMCHPLNLSHAEINFLADSENASIRIIAEIRLTGKTGVEMEALTAVSVAALTIYDMCKSLDKGMKISEIVLLSKTGGKSGTYTREEQTRSYAD
jgi:cyclic pyranopterin phosphate synthase